LEDKILFEATTIATGLLLEELRLLMKESNQILLCDYTLSFNNYAE